MVTEILFSAKAKSVQKVEEVAKVGRRKRSDTNKREKSESGNRDKSDSEKSGSKESGCDVTESIKVIGIAKVRPSPGSKKVNTASWVSKTQEKDKK